MRLESRFDEINNEQPSNDYETVTRNLMEIFYNGID